MQAVPGPATSSCSEQLFFGQEFNNGNNSHHVAAATAPADATQDAGSQLDRQSERRHRVSSMSGAPTPTGLSYGVASGATALQAQQQRAIKKRKATQAFQIVGETSTSILGTLYTAAGILVSLL